MSCAACSSRVEKAVAKQPGAQQVAVNLLKNSMVVEYDESQLSSAQIIAAVEKAGYGASLHAKPGSAPAAQTAETGGASAAQKAYSDMKKASRPLAHLHHPAVLSLDGPHDGLAAARVLPRHGKCDDVRIHAVFAAAAHRLYQPPVLYRRLQDAVAALAEHGFADRTGLQRRHRVRHLRHL